MKRAGAALAPAQYHCKDHPDDKEQQPVQMCHPIYPHHASDHDTNIWQD